MVTKLKAGYTWVLRLPNSLPMFSEKETAMLRCSVGGKRTPGRLCPLGGRGVVPEARGRSALPRGKMRAPHNRELHWEVESKLSPSGFSPTALLLPGWSFSGQKSAATQICLGIVSSPQGPQGARDRRWQPEGRVTTNFTFASEWGEGPE